MAKSEQEILEELEKKYRSNLFDKNGELNWNGIDRENAKEEYIHSEEFIEKFGDWEKINRLEKLKNAPTLEKDGKIIINGTDYTDKVAEMRKNEDRKGLREIMSLLKNEIRGSYAAPDMDNESIDITSATMKELNRFPLNSRQIEATLYIPDLLKNGIFICNEKNEDLVTNPEIDHYSYLLNGIKIAGEDYTAKSVIAVAKDGKKYYDHKLSKIEKGRILNNLPLLTDRESLGSLPYDLNDNRLLRICQVPELPYLEMKNGKWQPKEEAIQAVKDGKLYIEKIGQNYQMYDSLNLVNSIAQKEITLENFIHKIENNCGTDKSVKNILLQSANIIRNLDENSKRLLRDEFSKAEIKGQDSLVDFLDKKINPKKETKRSIQKSKESDFERTR